MRKILAIESGGIRAIISALILSQIEKTTRRSASEEFDLITGCGSGSILAIGLALGMRAEDIVQYFQQNGKKVYRGWWLTALLKRTALNALLPDVMSADALRFFLRDLLGPSAFADCRVPTICVNSTWPTKTFESWRSQTGIQAAEVAALSALSLREGYSYAYGRSLTSAKVRWPTEQLQLVHVGTGREDDLAPSNQGKLGWGRIVVPFLCQAHLQSQQDVLMSLHKHAYVQLNPSIGRRAAPSDDASPGNLERLASLTRAYLEQEPVRLKILSLVGG